MVNEEEGNQKVRPLGGPRSIRKSACSSSSMLLSPRNSVVIVVDPLKSIASGFNPSIKKELEAKTTALVRAANTLNIAVIVSALGVDGDTAELIEGTRIERDDPKSVCRAVLADNDQKPNLQMAFWRLLDGLNK